MARRGKFGNQPFKQLEPPRVKAANKVAPSPPEPMRPIEAVDESLLFVQAMRDVRPVKAGPDRILRTPPARLPDPGAEEREVEDELRALVRGESPFDISETDEYLEGAADDLDKRTRLKLRRGDLAVQAHLDLHGLRREEAHDALKAFLVRQRAAGRRCLLIVHGRGLNSPDRRPVIKENVARWLTRGVLGTIVLGFCTARPSDGGGGAVYVLLRR